MKHYYPKIVNYISNLSDDELLDKSDMIGTNLNGAITVELGNLDYKLLCPYGGFDTGRPSVNYPYIVQGDKHIQLLSYELAVTILIRASGLVEDFVLDMDRFNPNGSLLNGILESL